MEPTPPNKVSFDRLSDFQADKNCDSRSWKTCLSILTSSAITADYPWKSEWW